MNLLNEGLMMKAVMPTSYTKKITIDNQTKAYQVYKIDLDLLYYNDQNDRIATWISQYKDENGENSLKLDDVKMYNEIIHNFIRESNPEALKKTQTNINLVGQREAGVVLADGRIIDGNRRFTCLRNIQKNSDDKIYFEAIILPLGVDVDAKKIKMLELALQQGEDVKVDYSPIDKLVGIYNDLILNKLLTIQEYASSVNRSERSIVNEKENAQLMVDFLDFINASRKFYICRNLDLAGPLLELQTMLHRIDDPNIIQQLKESVFCNFLMKPESDMTRYIRKLKKICITPHLLDYLKDQIDINEKVKALIPNDSKIMTDSYISTIIRTNEEVCDLLRENLNKYVALANRDETKNRPSKLIKDSYIKLEEIDDRIFEKLDEEQKKEISKNLDKVLKKIEELKSKL